MMRDDEDTPIEEWKKGGRVVPDMMLTAPGGFCPPLYNYLDLSPLPPPTRRVRFRRSGKPTT